MVKISGYRKGFTLVEVSIVILLILILAIPISTLAINYVRGNLFESSYIKEQYFANVIMQDIEQRIRRADDGSISFSNYTLSFTYTDADAAGTKKSTLYCVYKLDTVNQIFQRVIGTSANPPLSIFPPGLESGTITDFSVSVSGNVATIYLKTKSNFVLQKSIYLLNYSR